MTDEVQISIEVGRFRSRDVEFVSGSFDQLVKRIPLFELAPFRLSDNHPSNPHLQTVVRQPLSAVESAVPVGVVSNSYELVQHRDVARLCREALEQGQLSLMDLKCELGLTPLSEYMVFRVYLPDDYGFTAKDGFPTSLRVECINSVDGSHRLLIFYSWLRLVCQNGMMVRDTRTEVREIHDQRLDLESIAQTVRHGLGKAAQDAKQLQEWDNARIDLERFGEWVNSKLANTWGKKAASRVYHLALSGVDTEWVDPFEGGEPTEKQVRSVGVVPGASRHAESLYDILQAMTWVATQRANLEERIAWQAQVGDLTQDLKKMAPRERRWGAS